MRRAAEQDEKVSSKLLYQPALDYIRTLRRILDKDPDYLEFHVASISMEVRNFLASSGDSRPWTKPDDEIIHSVKEAIVSLRSFEK